MKIQNERVRFNTSNWRSELKIFLLAAIIHFLIVFLVFCILAYYQCGLGSGCYNNDIIVRFFGAIYGALFFELTPLLELIWREGATGISFDFYTWIIYTSIYSILFLLIYNFLLPRLSNKSIK